MRHLPWGRRASATRLYRSGDVGGMPRHRLATQTSAPAAKTAASSPPDVQQQRCHPTFRQQEPVWDPAVRDAADQHDRQPDDRVRQQHPQPVPCEPGPVADERPIERDQQREHDMQDEAHPRRRRAGSWHEQVVDQGDDQEVRRQDAAREREHPRNPSAHDHERPGGDQDDGGQQTRLIREVAEVVEEVVVADGDAQSVAVYEHGHDCGPGDGPDQSPRGVRATSGSVGDHPDTLCG